MTLVPPEIPPSPAGRFERIPAVWLVVGGILSVQFGAAIAKALALPEMRERYTAMGLDASALSPAEYAAYLREDVARWKKVVVAAKLPPQ